ncbi:MAG: metallopeptidase family protein [Alphaproteobacteria bacterium]|nr:metallopeptidase family protein [Alphaproteobacteria bacterium]
MERQQIIMHFATPPSAEDLHVIATEAIENLPDELAEMCENLSVLIEDFADEAMQDELELEDPYDLIALYRSGKQISPGVESKVANDDDVLIIYRRALLDMWCETGEDLNALTRQAIIEELGHNFDFSEQEIDEMNQRHYQGML